VKRLLIAFVFLLIPSLVFATAEGTGIVINDQGTSGAPVSVTTALMIIRRNTARYQWCIEPETVAIRIEVSTGSGAASPAPSATVGFYIPAGTTYCERMGSQATGQIGSAINEVDACSTAGATSVDTWEEVGAP